MAERRMRLHRRYPLYLDLVFEIESGEIFYRSDETKYHRRRGRGQKLDDLEISLFKTGTEKVILSPAINTNTSNAPLTVEYVKDNPQVIGRDFNGQFRPEVIERFLSRPFLDFGRGDVVQISFLDNSKGKALRCLSYTRIS